MTEVNSTILVPENQEMVQERQHLMDVPSMISVASPLVDVFFVFVFQQLLSYVPSHLRAIDAKLSVSHSFACPQSLYTP